MNQSTETNDQGLAGAVELAVAAALILIPAALLVASLPSWIAHREALELIAQEAARAFVLADNDDAAAAAAMEVAMATALNRGLDVEDIEIVFSGQLVRGAEVTATVTGRAPLLQVPGLGSFMPNEVSVSHTERVDDYRGFP